MNLWDMKALHNKLCMTLEQRFLEAGLDFHLNECVRAEAQAVLNSYGESRRHALAVVVAEDYPALAVALMRADYRSKSPLMTVHRFGLARDYNLFRDRLYLTATEEHRPFGVWWKAQHALCRWGGDWGDGNHYSLEYLGVK